MSIKIKLNNDWVDTNIKAVRGVNHVNSEDVYTKEETEKKFATKTEVQTQINNSITKENIENTIEAWLEEDNESTNGEVYTKQESDALFSGKVSKTDIVQSTGTSETAVMSQKAVSDIVDELEWKVTNVADEEDITSIEENGKQKLKFADRNYNPQAFSGKGYKILRKNIQTIDGVRKNILTQDMINNPDTIYEIRYDFDLNNQNIDIKKDCTLLFSSGSIVNGTITGNNTRLSDNVKLSNIKIQGTFANEYCKTSFYCDADDNSDNIENLFKISPNVIITSKNYVISRPLILPYHASLSCDIGCSILLEELGCIYVTHSNRLSNLTIYISRNLKNTEHIILIDTNYIYKSIENEPSVYYKSIFNIFIKDIFIDNRYVKVDKIIDIRNTSNKNGSNINISDCIFQCISNISISLITDGEGSWLTSHYFNNISTVYSDVGFYINGTNGAISPGNLVIRQCSIQAIESTTYFIEARAVQDLKVFYCQPWDWQLAKTEHPFLFTDKCSVSVIRSGSYPDYDFEGDRTLATNKINFTCGDYSTNMGYYESLPKAKSEKYTLKEIFTLPRGVYKIPPISTLGESLGIPTPSGGLLIVDGGFQGCVSLTYYDNNKGLYTYVCTKIIDNVEDRFITSRDWYCANQMVEDDNPLEYKINTLFRNSNDKLYFVNNGGKKKDCLGRTLLSRETHDATYNIKLNDYLDIGRVLYSERLKRAIMWDGSAFIDVLGYLPEPNKGTTEARPTLDATQVGFQYYDTTLKKYIVWNGTEWTNMDGTNLI